MRKFNKYMLIVSFAVGMALLVLVPIVYFITKDAIVCFILFYFGLGSWQLLSFLMQYSRRKKEGSNELYKFYAGTLFLILILGLVFLSFIFLEISLPMFIYMFFMLFSSPFLALIYLYIEYREFKSIQKNNYHE